jgi:alkylation response protein AidB-like acyl-CoA dehydrogenase
MTATRAPVGNGSRTADPERQEMLRRVRNLGPLVREHAEQAEQRRRLAPEVVAGLREAGLFRLLLPRSLGGLELDPVTCALVVEELARLDSAAGWALQAGNEGAWWAARLPTGGAEELYGEDPSMVVSAAFHPPQQAAETGGGFRITGRGPLASNIHDAGWLFLTALVMDGDRPMTVDGLPRLIGLYLRAAEVKVLDTWYSLGMRGTDSHDVVIENVFVPTSRTFPLAPDFEPGDHHRGPLYRIPGVAAAAFLIAPVPLAVARSAIDEVETLAQTKTAFGFTRPLRERPMVQAAVARAEATLRSARLFFYDTLDSAWERAVRGERSTLRQRADLLLAGAHAATAASQATDLMHRTAGTTGIYVRNPLERHFRDAQTLRQHGFLSENRLEASGQVYLGVEPEFPMVRL